MQKWFVDVWEEDMPMRERRLKGWKLGFQDFKGIDYVNNPEVKKKSDDSRKYELKLPIPKITHLNKVGKNKIFKRECYREEHLWSLLQMLYSM